MTKERFAGPDIDLYPPAVVQPLDRLVNVVLYRDARLYTLAVLPALSVLDIVVSRPLFAANRSARSRS